MATCSHTDCDRDARSAIRITRPTRANVKITIFTDDREAPSKASALCYEHTLTDVPDLLRVLVEGDG